MRVGEQIGNVAVEFPMDLRRSKLRQPVAYPNAAMERRNPPHVDAIEPSQDGLREARFNKAG